MQNATSVFVLVRLYFVRICHIWDVSFIQFIIRFVRVFLLVFFYSILQYLYCMSDWPQSNMIKHKRSFTYFYKLFMQTSMGLLFFPAPSFLLMLIQKNNGGSLYTNVNNIK